MGFTSKNGSETRHYNSDPPGTGWFYCFRACVRNRALDGGKCKVMENIFHRQKRSLNSDYGCHERSSQSVNHICYMFQYVWYINIRLCFQGPISYLPKIVKENVSVKRAIKSCNQSPIKTKIRPRTWCAFKAPFSK